MKDHLNRLIRMPPQPARTRGRSALPHQHITPTSPTRREHIPHHQTSRPTPLTRPRARAADSPHTTTIAPAVAAGAAGALAAVVGGDLGGDLSGRR